MNKQRKSRAYQPSCEVRNYGSVAIQMTSVPVDPLIKRIYEPDETNDIPTDIGICLNLVRGRQDLVPHIQSLLQQELKVASPGADIDAALDLVQGQFETFDDYLSRLEFMHNDAQQKIADFQRKQNISKTE